MSSVITLGIHPQGFQFMDVVASCHACRVILRGHEHDCRSSNMNAGHAKNARGKNTKAAVDIIELRYCTYLGIVV